MIPFTFFNGYNRSLPPQVTGYWGMTRYVVNNLNVNHELETLLVNEIAREINREITQRVFAQTINEELIPIQPMDLPIGVINYMDIKISQDLLYKFKFLKNE